MTTILSWLANKLAAPILLALCLLLALAVTVQTVRLNGVSILGWQIASGYKPSYEALIAQNLSDKLTRANAIIAENNARITATDAANKSLADQLNTLHAKWDNYVPTEVVKYVPKNLVTVCVPDSLLWLLDAAGTGADISTVAARPGESGDACSGMDVPSAESAVMQNVKHFPELVARITNARDAWEAQRKLNSAESSK